MNAQAAFQQFAHNVASAPEDHWLRALCSGGHTLIRQARNGQLPEEEVHDAIARVANEFDAAGKVGAAEADTIFELLRQAKGEGAIPEPVPEDHLADSIGDEEQIDESPPDNERAAIPLIATEALASWDRTLANLENPEQHRAKKFLEAATEILRLAKPGSTPQAWQQLVDDLYALGNRHGLPDNAVQTLMRSATQDGQPEPHKEDGPPPEWDERAAPEWLDEMASPPAARFSPVAIDDVTISAEPQCLVDGILPARGLASVVGAPKSGKSFFASHMLCSVARGVPYAGRETLQGPVIYLTGEGVSGFKRRLVAMRQHLGIEGQGVPFFMIENVPDLGSETTDLPQLLAELTAFAARACPEGPRAIALDTLARCMGEGDENSARDMGRFVNRCAAIERHFRCVVVVVHHVGKDPTRGGRGSNALNGAADVTMMVEKSEAFSTVRIEEMKDGREGQEWRFRLAPYDLSATFDDGCAAPSRAVENSTCVVEILSEPGRAQPRATKKAAAPQGVAGDLLKIIKRAVEDAGTTTADSVAVPNNARAITRNDLKRFCETMAWQDELQDNSRRAMLSKTLSQLRDRGLVGFDKNWVWLG